MIKFEIENEVNRCILCVDAPCTKNCNKNMCPDKIIRSLYFENEYGAIKNLSNYNCENCSAPCINACVLKSYEKPIDIICR